tara:strand:+ start:181 stop:789 length:609 start_codon:yes stop_codon:yes gene_type:complete
MSKLYIDTQLKSRVVLHPSQMNNDIYINLKESLVKKVEGKCVNNHGFVVTVYEIVDHSSGEISDNSTLGSAIYTVTFSCRLCKPLVNKEIICKVDRMNQHLISVVNGPLIVIIPMDRLNESNFFLDHRDNIRYKKDENNSEILKQNDYVKVMLETISFDDKDTKIKAIGILKDMATKKEEKLFQTEQYKDGETEDVVVKVED